MRSPLSALLDASIYFSFDASGFRRHARGFDPSDIDVDMGGKRCLVTGANSGIGLATAQALARRGAEVWILCRNPERGRAAEARELQQAKDGAAEQARRARAAAEAAAAAIEEAAEELAGTTYDPALTARKQAQDLLDALEANVGRAEKGAEKCQLVASSNAAAAQHKKAAAIADQSVEESGRIKELMQRAVDLARQAAAEAEALQKIRQEIGGIAEAADAAVERAVSVAAEPSPLAYSNSTITADTSSLLTEVTRRTCSMVLSSFSTTRLTSASTSRAEAPG